MCVVVVGVRRGEQLAEGHDLVAALVEEAEPLGVTALAVVEALTNRIGRDE